MREYNKSIHLLATFFLLFYCRQTAKAEYLSFDELMRTVGDMQDYVMSASTHHGQNYDSSKGHHHGGSYDEENESGGEFNHYDNGDSYESSDYGKRHKYGGKRQHNQGQEHESENDSSDDYYSEEGGNEGDHRRSDQHSAHGKQGSHSGGDNLFDEGKKSTGFRKVFHKVESDEKIVFHDDADGGEYDKYEKEDDNNHHQKEQEHGEKAHSNYHHSSKHGGKESGISGKGDKASSGGGSKQTDSDERKSDKHSGDDGGSYAKDSAVSSKSQAAKYSSNKKDGGKGIKKKEHEKQHGSATGPRLVLRRVKVVKPKNVRDIILSDVAPQRVLAESASMRNNETLQQSESLTVVDEPIGFHGFSDDFQSFVNGLEEFGESV